MSDTQTHPEWASHPVVEESLKTHLLLADVLQHVLDTVDAYEKMFPGVPMTEFTRVAKMLDTPPGGRLVGPRDPLTGLTPADERMFDLADSGMSRAQMVEHFQCESRAAVEASMIRNPMTDDQQADVDAKQGRTYTEAAKHRRRSKCTIQNSMLKDRYHRSRGLYRYEEKS